jgi:hypothetical protein
MDVKFSRTRSDNTSLIRPGQTPQYLVGYTCLLNLSRYTTNNLDDGIWFINGEGKLGSRGIYDGYVEDNRWNRLALVHNLLEGKASMYLDGRLINQFTSLNYYYSPFAMGSNALLFADNDEENCDGAINSFQIQQEILTDEQIRQMGSASADGIPLPKRPTIHSVVLNATSPLNADSKYTISWSCSNPQGYTSIDLYIHNQVIKHIAYVPMKDNAYTWVLPPMITPNNDYQIRVTWMGDKKIFCRSSNFTIVNKQYPFNSLYNTPLLANADFEDGLQHWTVIYGNAELMERNIIPSSFRNFCDGEYYIGSKSAGDFAVKQTIDLVEVGFLPRELDNNNFIQCNYSIDSYYQEIIGSFQIRDLNQVYLLFYDSIGNRIGNLYSIQNGASAGVHPIAGYLPKGTRKVDVVIESKHKRRRTNLSIIDSIQLTLEPAPKPIQAKISMNPTLHFTASNSVVVQWETNGNSYPTYVEWGIQSTRERITDQPKTIYLNSQQYIHKATLQQLIPNVTYVYRVSYGNDHTQQYSFTYTPCSQQNYRIAWFANSRDYDKPFRSALNQIKTHSPHLLASAGDITHDNNRNRWVDYWLNPLETFELGQRIPLVYAMGHAGGEIPHIYAYLNFPDDKTWFSFVCNSTYFIFLNSNHKRVVPENEYSLQDEWLQRELQKPECQSAAFRVVVTLEPPFSDIWHDPGFDGNPRIRNDWVPLFENHNVDIVISGYTDHYMRGKQNDVIYTIIGGLGKNIDTDLNHEWGFWDKKIPLHHFVIMDLEPSQLTWKAYNLNNELIDTFRLVR